MSSENDNKFCMLVLLVCCAFIIATVGVVLGALSLAQVGLNGRADYNIYAGSSGGTTGDSGVDSGVSSPSSSSDDEVWLFAIGDYDNRLEYLDPVSNQLKGYNADIIDAVCDIANKNCELVWDVYSNCWESPANERARGGVGLMANWYTACTGWIQTYERLLTFGFTRPFSQKGKVALYAASGSSQDYSDLSGLKVGFLATWFSDAPCLARYTTDPSYPIVGAELPSDSQKITYDIAEDLIAAVQNGDVDVAFSVRRPQLDDALETISPADFPNNCEAGGGSMMTSKSNQEFIRWWDDAFSRLVGTSRYDTICQNIVNEHGDIPGSTATDICIGY
ncbi:uncharacterized protein LOC135153876 [Lytechinus pictus]|uniref:uncharacterized protein LOC135153876 n=1 Tax=Lytechinus pictus TaxID=7653 RepID=UPI0030B9B4AB